MRAESTRKDIAVILVGLNTRDYVKNCLESLAKTDWRGYTHEIIYVDNGSADDSVEMARREFPEVKVIANRENLGFCKAANQAAALANSRYHWQLNNDTLVYPDSAPLLAEFLDQTPDAAAVGSRLLNPDLSDQWSARRFPSGVHAFFGRRSRLSRWFPQAKPVRDYLYKDQLLGDKPFPVDWVPTVCMLLREEVFQRLGGMPEEFYYWHEAVFCDRIRQEGGKIYVVPLSKVIHFEGKGGGPRPYRVRRWHIKDFHRGAYRFYCERNRPGKLSLTRWFIALGLTLRASLLLTANWLTSLRERMKSHA
jgi:GT2 family glycosyltransferase